MWQNSARWSHRVLGEAEWLKRLGVLALTLCSRWGKMVHFPKIHSSITVWVSDKRFFRKSATQSFLLGAARSFLCWTQAWQGIVVSSYKTGQCTPLVGAVTIGMLNPGKLVSGYLADILLSQWLLVDWIQTDFHHQMLWGLLFPPLLLWVGDPCTGLRPHAPGEGVLKLRYPSGFSATVHGCGGQTLMHLSFLAVPMWLLL